MSSAIRCLALAAGAAALLSAQTAYAAPALSRAAIDPLVSLSALGTAQSRAAVCAAGTSAATAGAALATQAVTPAPGCLLPVTAPPPAPPPVETIPPPPPPRAGLGINPLLLGLLGALLLAGVAFAILSDDDDDGELFPISPA